MKTKTFVIQFLKIPKPNPPAIILQDENMNISDVITTII
jgi:hypothetical protein